MLKSLARVLGVIAAIALILQPAPCCAGLALVGMESSVDSPTLLRGRLTQAGDGQLLGHLWGKALPGNTPLLVYVFVIVQRPGSVADTGTKPLPGFEDSIGHVDVSEWVLPLQDMRRQPLNGFTQITPSPVIEGNFRVDLSLLPGEALQPGDTVTLHLVAFDKNGNKSVVTYIYSVTSE